VPITRDLHARGAEGEASLARNPAREGVLFHATTHEDSVAISIDAGVGVAGRHNTLVRKGMGGQEARSLFGHRWAGVTPRLPWCLVLLVVLLVLSPSQAEAQRGFLFITYGEDYEVLESELPELPGMVLAFRHSYFGVFWMNLWTWGGEFVVCVPLSETSGRCRSAQSQDPAEIAAALGLDGSSVAKPFLYSYPPLLILVVVVSVLAMIGQYMAGKEPPVSNDPESAGGSDVPIVEVVGDDGQVPENDDGGRD